MKIEPTEADRALADLIASKAHVYDRNGNDRYRCDLAAQLIAEQLAALQQQLAEARKDGERLDWLEKTVDECAGVVEFGIGDNGNHGIWMRGAEVTKFTGYSVRGALDAVRNQSKGTTI